MCLRSDHTAALVLLASAGQRWERSHEQNGAWASRQMPPTFPSSEGVDLAYSWDAFFPCFSLPCICHFGGEPLSHLAWVLQVYRLWFAELLC